MGGWVVGLLVCLARGGMNYRVIKLGGGQTRGTVSRVVRVEIQRE